MNTKAAIKSGHSQMQAANLGSDDRALVLYVVLATSLVLERRYDKDKLSGEERGRARQSLETKEIMIRLRTNLKT